MTESRVFFGFVCRQVPGAECYWISECGGCLVSTVKPTPHRMKPFYHNGYLYIERPGKQRMRVHRMVASAWLEGDGENVNHKDGNKFNNHASNLEYCTALENTRHALREGIHNRPEKPLIGVHLVTGDGWWIKSRREAERMGLSHWKLRRAAIGARLEYLGYQWSYAEAA